MNVPTSGESVVDPYTLVVRRRRLAWSGAVAVALCALMPLQVLGWAALGVAAALAFFTLVDAAYTGRHSGWLAAATGSAVQIDITTKAMQWWAVGTFVMIGTILVGWNSPLY